MFVRNDICCICLICYQALKLYAKKKNKNARWPYFIGAIGAKSGLDYSVATVWMQTTKNAKIRFENSKSKKLDNGKGSYDGRTKHVVENGSI